MPAGGAGVAGSRANAGPDSGTVASALPTVCCASICSSTHSASMPDICFLTHCQTCTRLYAAGQHGLQLGKYCAKTSLTNKLCTNI